MSEAKPVKDDSNPRDYVVERPPSLMYQIDIATSQEKAEIIIALARMNRQTMNFRMMKESYAIILRDLEAGGKIIGWQGYGFDPGVKYPEKFSLHLDDSYRAFLLGLILEHAFALHMAKRGVGFAYLRMESATNSSLLKWRTSNGFFKELDRAQLDPRWIAQCKQCELYGAKCSVQAYFTVDLTALIDFATRRLGNPLNSPIPAKVVLKEGLIRKDEARSKFVAKWAA